MHCILDNNATSEFNFLNMITVNLFMQDIVLFFGVKC